MSTVQTSSARQESRLSSTLDAVDESPGEACQTKLAEAITSGDATTDSESAENDPRSWADRSEIQDRSTDELTTSSRKPPLSFSFSQTASHSS
ncbi:hypothetical protein C8039_02055 [Halogeometricum sp. wsp3]|nr:hypothetical protein C8039_02055 [Halogeometricum sp. wsp3]